MEITSTKSNQINTKNQNIPSISTYNSKTFENKASYYSKLNSEKSNNRNEKINTDIISKTINTGIKSKITNRSNKNQKIEVLSNRMKYKNSISASKKNIDKTIELNNSYTLDQNNFRNNVFFHSIIETSKKEKKPVILNTKKTDSITFNQREPNQIKNNISYIISNENSNKKLKTKNNRIDIKNIQNQYNYKINYNFQSSITKTKKEFKKEIFNSNIANKSNNLKGSKLEKFHEDNTRKNNNIRKDNLNEVSKNKNLKYTKIKNIKSLYIQKLIFSFTNEKVKLNMIKYSKCLQNIFSINIENYKKISGKYKKGTKWYGKEYLLNTDRLIFEGGYKNGKRNGKGKEYDDLYCEVLFEGEYKNGKRNGKGKEFKFYYGYLDFEGEYLNGKKWNGKKYNKNGEVLYELKNGKGNVKEYDNNDHLIFEGQYINGERNGKGKEYKEGILIFEGEYSNGKRWNGNGLKNGKGYIKEYYEEGKLKFEGEYLNGERNGKGKEYIKHYEEINFRECESVEIVDYYILGYEGEYKNGERNGKGKEYDIDNNYKPYLRYEGEYINGKWSKGKEYSKEGKVIFEGEYLNGEKWNGKRKEYNRYGELIFEGEYFNGKKWNGYEYEYDYYSKLKSQYKYLNGEKKIIFEK